MIEFPEDDKGSEAIRSALNQESCRQLSATNVSDLTIAPNEDEDAAAKDAAGLVRKHGAVMLPPILTKNTTQALLKLATDWNNVKKGDHFQTPNKSKRSVYGISVSDDPIVPTALEEIGRHAIFRPMLDDLLGPDATFTGFHFITNMPGAEAQQWHEDFSYDFSPRKYPHFFTRSYRLAISLQTTNERMGGTGICPGTHQCHYRRAPNPAVYKDCFTVTVPESEALFFDRSMFHRGGHHLGMPGDPPRVFLFLTFSPSNDGAQLDHVPGTEPAILMEHFKFGMHGHTINDFTTIKDLPWTLWDALGLNSSRKGRSMLYFWFRRLVYSHPPIYGNLPRWPFAKLGLPHGQFKLLWIHIEDFWKFMLKVALVWTILCVGIIRLFGKKAIHASKRDSKVKIA